MVINAIVLANKFPFFTTSEISALHQQFMLLDKDAAGMFDGKNLGLNLAKRAARFVITRVKLIHYLYEYSLYRNQTINQ